MYFIKKFLKQIMMFIIKMVKSVLKIVKTFSNHEKLIWSGSQIDLMEIVYMVYMTEKVYNEKGRRATINELAEALFSLMNKKAPLTPTKVIDNLKKRKYPKESSILYKVLKKLYHMF